MAALIENNYKAEFILILILYIFQMLVKLLMLRGKNYSEICYQNYIYQM